MLCGENGSAWDMKMLSESIHAAHGYDKTSPQFTYFIQYACNLDKEMKKLFLKFITGSPKLPCGGFAKLNPPLTIAKRIAEEGKAVDLYLPSVMTCQNYLKLPEYTSYESLHKNFDFALKEGQNSFTLS